MDALSSSAMLYVFPAWEFPMICMLTYFHVQANGMMPYQGAGAGQAIEVRSHRIPLHREHY
jgi:hypothetical protein